MDVVIIDDTDQCRCMVFARSHTHDPQILLRSDITRTIHPVPAISVNCACVRMQNVCQQCSPFPLLVHTCLAYLLMPSKQDSTTAQLWPRQSLVNPLHQRISLIDVERLEKRCDICCFDAVYKCEECLQVRLLCKEEMSEKSVFYATLAHFLTTRTFAACISCPPYGASVRRS